MAERLDIICIAQPSWSGNYAKSTVLLMQEVSRLHNVLYVDYAYTWNDVFKALLRKKNIPLAKVLGLKNRVTNYSDDKRTIQVLSLPPVLPVNFLNDGKIFQWLTKINAFWISLFINKTARKFNFSNPIVINAFAPLLGKSLKGKLRELMTVYYNYDDISTAQWSARHGKRMEELFSKEADIVIVSSDQLKKERSHLNENTFVVKNGVSDAWFTERKCIKNKTKIIAGFVGSLDSRIDYSLILKLIVLLPDVEFWFVGRKECKEFDQLMEYKNVKWTPPVDYEKLPDVIQHFDVGLIPFAKTQFTSKIYPLKINEYLALGKPVVMTSFATLPEFEGIVYQADSPIDFAHTIKVAVDSITAEQSSHYKMIASNNSWSKRAEEFIRLIKDHLTEKSYDLV